MFKLTIHPHNFMREIAMIYFTEVYGLFPTISLKYIYGKVYEENLYYEILLLQLKYYLRILKEEN